ncbi:recombination-associated protein RdgC [Vibrio alginolyticus]
MFKTFVIYKLPEDFNLEPNLHSEMFERLKAKPLTGAIKTKYGWAELLQSNKPYIKLENDYIFRIEKRFRSVASSTLDEAVRQKMIQLAQDSPRTWGVNAKVSSQDVKNLREMCENLLIPKSLTRFKDIIVWFNTELKFLFIGSSGNKEVEAIIDLFRLTFKTFPASPLTVNNDVSSVFTSWLSSLELPPTLAIKNGDIAFENRANGANKVRYSNQDIESDEINANLLAQKRPLQLSCEWNATLGFTVNNELKFSKIKQLVLLKEKIKTANKEMEINNPAQEMEAKRVKDMTSYTLTRLSILNLIKEILPSLNSSTGFAGGAQSNTSELIEGFVESID